LTGVTPKQKALIHMMQKRAESELLEPVGDHFHYATTGLGDGLLPYKRPEWAARTEWGNHRRDRAVAGMRCFNGVLETQPFIAGDAFSMADISVLAGLMFAGFAQIAIPAECVALIEWQRRMQERASVAHPA
jgi:glutathione S-transferase